MVSSLGIFLLLIVILIVLTIITVPFAGYFRGNQLTKTSNQNCCLVKRTKTTVLTPSITVMTTGSTITSTTSATYGRIYATVSAWSLSHLSFCRIGNCASSFFNYAAILINVTISGLYRITSQGLLDTYGYLYSPRFDPQCISCNLLMSDDDSAGGVQFELLAILQNSTLYILVVTTYDANMGGAFILNATGPAFLSWTQIKIVNESNILNISATYNTTGNEKISTVV